MALFPVIDGQVQFDLSVPSGSIYRNGLRYSPDGAVFAALDGQISNYSQGIGLTADGAVVITGGAGIIGWQNGLPRDVESGAIFVTVGDALTYASGLPFTAQGALAISSDAPVPTLDFLFAGATELDPRVDFTRGSEATGWVNGQLKTFGINEPRFVTDPATGYSGLLLEPFASTNLLRWGGDFTKEVWRANGATRIPNQPDSRGGGKAVTVLGPGTSPFQHFTTTNQSGQHTFTIVAKAVEGRNPVLTFGCRNVTTSLNDRIFTVNLVNGDTTAEGVTVNPMPNGFWKIVWTTLESFVITEGDSLFLYWGQTIGSPTDTVGITVDYAQLETGTKATSFIPTGDSQVTRAADQFVLPVGDWYRPDRGTLIVPAATPIGETVATFGDIVIASNSDEMKTYTVPYSSPIGASHLELGAGLFSSVQYYPQVLP